MTKGIGLRTSNIEKAIIDSYKNDISDEFIEPIFYSDNKKINDGVIEQGDFVMFFNFRTDRGRQLTKALSQCDFDEFE